MARVYRPSNARVKRVTIEGDDQQPVNGDATRIPREPQLSPQTMQSATRNSITTKHRAIAHQRTRTTTTTATCDTLTQARIGERRTSLRSALWSNMAMSEIWRRIKALCDPLAVPGGVEAPSACANRVCRAPPTSRPPHRLRVDANERRFEAPCSRIAIFCTRTPVHVKDPDIL